MKTLKFVFSIAGFVPFLDLTFKIKHSKLSILHFYFTLGRKVAAASCR